MGGLCDAPGVGSEAYDFGDAFVAARRWEGEVDLEPAVAVERFAGLPITWLGLAVELLKGVVQGWVVVEQIWGVFDHFLEKLVDRRRGLKFVHGVFSLWAGNKKAPTCWRRCGAREITRAAVPGRKRSACVCHWCGRRGPNRRATGGPGIQLGLASRVEHLDVSLMVIVHENWMFVNP